MQDVAVREVAGLLGAGAPPSVCQEVGYMDGWGTSHATLFLFFLVFSDILRLFTAMALEVAWELSLVLWVSCSLRLSARH